MARKSLTYGTLPTRDEFDDAFEWHCSATGRFMISNDKGGRDGNYDARELWHLINDQLNDDEEIHENNAEDFVGAVLSILGFEWI